MLRARKLTIKDLRNVCTNNFGPNTLNVSYDLDCQCYRVTASPGSCFEPGLHELVGVFGGGIIGNGQTRSEALRDLISRLQEYAVCGGLDACEQSECDFCKQG